MQGVKTIFLLSFLTLMFVWIGGMIAGQSGMLIALVMAIGMNFWSYYNSDKAVLKHYNAIEVNEEQARGLYEIVERLAYQANLPMPKVYIIPDSVPNAFATGRNHENAAVAVTEGLLEILDEEEVEGVLAHEMAHVEHYDILIGTIAASIAGAIAMLANFGMMFGGGDRESRPNPLIMIALVFIAPMAASVIQMAVSRNREFMADEGAARMTGHPEWLQSALAKLDNYSRGNHTLQEATPESAHMFIINPFSGKDISFQSLFSTHPKTEDRIARLEALKREV